MVHAKQDAPGSPQSMADRSMCSLGWLSRTQQRRPGMTILRLPATEPPPYGTRARSGHSLRIWLEAQLPVVVVEMLGRVVVRICQGHEVLEVRIPAGREVHPAA